MRNSALLLRRFLSRMQITPSLLITLLLLQRPLQIWQDLMESSSVIETTRQILLRSYILIPGPRVLEKKSKGGYLLGPLFYLMATMTRTTIKLLKLGVWYSVILNRLLKAVTFYCPLLLLFLHGTWIHNLILEQILMRQKVFRRNIWQIYLRLAWALQAYPQYRFHVVLGEVNLLDVQLVCK